MECDFFEVVLWSLVSIVVLFIMSKLMGNKQISQLNVFDYIIGISIGSIAAELASLQDVPKPLNNITAIVIYGFAAFFISFITNKSLKLRKFITGQPIVIMSNGTIYRKNLAKARLDISDFLTLCRQQGYFDINQINTAIIEYDGKLSILPNSDSRPLTPSDMNMNPATEDVLTTVIIDGHILSQNLQLTGHDTKWLKSRLSEQKLKSEEVFVAFCDNNGSISAYKMNNEHMEENRFE